MKLKVGDIVSCPECGTAQMKVTKEIGPGDQLKDAKFESLGFEMDSHRPGCHKCGERFMRQHPITGKTQIFTELDHWIPLTPEKPKCP